MTNPFATLDALGAAAAIRAGEASAIEIVEAVLAHIAARNPTLNTSRDPADEATQPAEVLTSNDPDRFAVDVLLPKDVRHPS